MKKLYIYIASAALVCIQYSCKKDLNAPPSQALVEGNVVVDQKSAENLLNGVYSRFVGTATRFNFLGHSWSQNQEIPPSNLAGLIRYGFGAGANDLIFNNLLPSQTGSYWTYPYSILNAANSVITEVGALPDAKINPGSRKAEIIAEARFLRAYGHWMLLGYFSEWNKIGSANGVLLRKEPLKLSNPTNPRNTVQESYDFILEDIDFAIANAADVRPNYYVNKTAAKALKMRVLMMRGAATDYTQTIALANEIIANPNYQLEPSLRDLVQVKGLTSKEVILGVTPYPNQLQTKGTYEFIQSSVYITHHNFRDLLAGDPRSTWMYAKATNSTQATIRDSFYLTKFNGPKIEDRYVIRLTEVHLLKAEAIVRSGGSMAEAKTILKNIAARAGVTNFTSIDNANTPTQLLVEIYKEVARNLVAENGAEWFTLIRLPFETVKQLRPTITDPKQLYWPVPLTEFQLNPTFGPQNSGYQ